MTKQLSALLFGILIWTHSFAQKPKNVATGKVEIESRIESYESQDDAFVRVERQAQIKAIEDRFGRVISQDNSMVIENTIVGSDLTTSESFNSISNSEVRGEWISYDGGYPKTEFFQYKDESWIKVTVKGVVREIDNTLSFETYSLNCPRLECKTTEFKNGGDFLQYFKCSEDGYIAVYLDDVHLSESFLILPDNTSKNNAEAVSQGKPYMLFVDKSTISPDYFAQNNLQSIDENNQSFILTLEEQRKIDSYIVYVIFSPTPFKKPLLESKASDDNVELPRSMPSNDFTDWLQKLRSRNDKIQVSKYSITLTE